MATKPLLRYLMIQFVMLLAIGSYAQQPQGIRFEGLARDNSGNLLASQAVSVKLSILSGGLSGEAVYVETHQLSTGSDGMFDLLIGTGSVESGSFQGINWGNGSYYLKVEMDPQGGSSFEFVGTSELMSVPYALYANKAADGFNGSFNDLSDEPVGQNYGDMLYWNGLQWTKILVGQDGQVLKSIDGIPAWSNLYQVPILSTPTLTSITFSGANVKAYVADGGYPVTERGFCWGSSPNPTVLNTKSIVGSNFGEFSTNIAGLVANQTYYIRAFAINELGIGYSQQTSFVTPPNIPSVTTLGANMTSSSTATASGSVVSPEYYDVTERGFCFSANPNPSIIDNKIVSGSGAGTFTAALSSLNPNEIINIRAYAQNSIGVGYGKVIRLAHGFPVITTQEVTGITTITANFSATIGNSSYPVTSRGFCFGKLEYPKLSDNAVFMGSGVGNFACTVNLPEQSIYYIRAFAIINSDTIFGNTQTFANDHICGQPITVQHLVSRGVAPNNCIISYNTVTNVPGEPNKCWIKSNLGGGWYWRFNKAQGYAESGSGLIPTTTWGDNSGNSNWAISNDPCRIELGGLWRLPTATEWTNVDAEGMWFFSSDPWQSLLQLGGGQYYDGFDFYREGVYHSSTQSSASSSFMLRINGEAVLVYPFTKDFGVNVRCVK